MTDPHLFILGSPRKPGVEVPLGHAVSRGKEIPDPADATEIAPGVRAAFLGSGDHILPDGTVYWGTMIAVWAEGDRRD